MNEPVWVLRSAIDAMHDAQLVEHGGAPGVRDAGLLESALARPKDVYVDGESDLFVLAAEYALAIAGNRPYADGNERTAFLAAYVFLRINGLHLVGDEAGAAAHMLAIASGETNEADFSDWLRANAKEV